jgi:hypothetical protein
VIETATKIKELEIERARLVEQNLNGENDHQIANLDSELALQQQLHDLVASTTADQLVAAKKIDDAFSNFADDLSGQLSDMLENWNGSLSSLSSSVFRKLAEQIFIKPGTDSLTSGISGALKGLFSSAQSTGGGGGGNPLAGFMDSFAGMFAAGGNLEPGAVGHRRRAWSRADLCRAARSGGHVERSGRAGQGGRRQTVNQTWNISTPDANSFRATGRQITRQAKQALGMQGA